MSTSRKSNSVILDNVDDYLAPSQACVNPLFQPASVEKSGKTENDNIKNEKNPAVVVPRRRKRRIQKANLNSTTNEIFTPDSPLVTNTKNKDKDDIIKASMADCLACSGCVTTAETVLMEQKHSLKSLKDRLSSPEQKRRSRIITISPNSWADLCRHWNFSTISRTIQTDDKYDNLHYYARFTTLLSKVLSAKVVVDGNVPLRWAWLDEAREFCHAYEKYMKDDKTVDTTCVDTCRPSIAINCQKIQYYQADGTSAIVENNGLRETPKMPMISGSCPALVCLVEKTLTKLVPNLSQTISPMSLVGMILKDKPRKVTNGNDLKDSNWDHWAIMPCHDKKLEASRKDFFIPDNIQEQAVDLVITTQECVELVEEWIASEQGASVITPQQVMNYLESLPPSDVSTSNLEPEEFPRKVSCLNDVQSLLVTIPSNHRLSMDKPSESIDIQKQMAFSSGGHANFIFSYAAKKLFNCTLDQSLQWNPASLSMKNVRSARLGKQQQQHYYEAKLFRQADGSFSCDNDSNIISKEPVLHFAIAHGMQTMQRALKQIEGNSIGLHYLEAMACPHGCVNGGGSIRSSIDTGAFAKPPLTTRIRETPSETKARVMTVVRYLEVPEVGISKMNQISDDSEQKIISSHVIPRTSYHVVPPLQHTMGAVAGEKVEDIQW